MTPLESWRHEQRAAHLYRVLARIEAGSVREALFAELAEDALRQSQVWAAAARKAGAAVPDAYRPDARTRLVARLTRALGPQAMRSALVAMKVRGLSVYTQAEPGHPVPDASGALERRHRGLASGGNLRAAVFGVNDGLVSNASLILGVAGASADDKVILLSGVAGLLAGAFSMAAGEYVSVRSQREMYEYQIALEREELAAYPEEEAAELALIYRARGLAPQDAERLAQAMIADPVRGLDTLAREELGLNPAELGSPWGAAAFSFASFAAGALIPLVPYLLLPGTRALQAAVALTASALFVVGAALSLFTGRPAVLGGLRMLIIGATAGAATYAIGALLGVSLG
jgi:VIT1/CCC1 family predicted Fe2+/Mn2+ transporter